MLGVLHNALCQRLLLILLFGPITVFSQNKYQVFIDLRSVVDDKLQVTLKLPQVDQSEIEYQMPKIVPGTYTIYDFGRFTENYIASDNFGNTLDIDSITANRRKIKNAEKLVNLSYWVEDTYDSEKGNFVFEPAGTNIDSAENFVLNTFGFIGYLDSYKNLPYELHISHPPDLHGTSALNKQAVNDTLDIFTAPDYFSLTDGPILYAEPDTTSFKISNTKINISVYSPNRVSDSELVAHYIQETMKAQNEYLFGELPVDEYTFLVYHYPGVFSGSLKLGALEHSYSTLFSLPNLSPLLISQFIKDFTAHEFFHVITPLTLHSEQIRDFDFINPKATQHLWMYEGVTEYSAGLAQAKYGPMTLKEYVAVLFRKIKGMQRYTSGLSLTELSLGCLDEHADEYGNVYQKGALIGLCLDIRLLQLSGGKMGIQQLMKTLSEMYGKEKAFKEVELFDIITSITFPEIRDFFRQYVEGDESLPLQEVFKAVGIKYTPEQRVSRVTFQGLGFSANENTKKVYFQSSAELGLFAQELDYQSGDILVKVNGKKVTSENYKAVLEDYALNLRSGDMVKITVSRKDEYDRYHNLKLSAQAIEKMVHIREQLSIDQDATTAQIKLRKLWVGH